MNKMKILSNILNKMEEVYCRIADSYNLARGRISNTDLFLDSIIKHNFPEFANVPCRKVTIKDITKYRNGLKKQNDKI